MTTVPVRLSNNVPTKVKRTNSTVYGGYSFNHSFKTKGASNIIGIDIINTK